MKPSEIREFTDEDSVRKETELAERLFALRLQRVTGQLENPAKLRQTRRDLARVLTIRRENQGTSSAE